MMQSQDPLDILVTKHRHGESTAFAALIEATQRQVRSCISARLWTMEAVDELVQDTYVEAFEHLDRYDGDGRFQAWLLGIARNLCRAWLEKRQREGQRREDLLGECLETLPAKEIDESAFLEDVERLQHCLAKLPPKSRGLLDRVYRDGWSLERLAKNLGSTAGSLAVTLFRLRKTLRMCLDHEVQS